MLKFSVKNVFRKKAVAILSSTGIAFGLMLMFVLGAFNAGVSAQFQENFAQVLGTVQVTERNPEGLISVLPLNIPDDLLNSEIGEDIEALNVEAELTQVFTAPYTSKIREEQDGDRLRVLGINQTLDQAFGGPSSKIIEGDLFETGEYEVIADSRLKTTSKLTLSVGDEIDLYLQISPIENITRSVTIVGFYDQDDSGAPGFVPRTYNLYTSLETIWDLLEQANLTNETYSTITLQFNVETNEEAQAYANKIEELSDQGEFGDVFLDAFSLASFQESIEATLSIFGAFTAVISIITALAGGMAIIVSQLTSVSERKKEFAILKSTGWKNSHIFKNVLYESLTLGLIGAGLGIGLGYGLIFGLSSSDFLFGSAANALVTGELILTVVGFALGVGVIGGTYPALKAAKVRPVVVLKGE